MDSTSVSLNTVPGLISEVIPSMTNCASTPLLAWIFSILAS